MSSSKTFLYMYNIQYVYYTVLILGHTDQFSEETCNLTYISNVHKISTKVYTFLGMFNIKLAEISPRYRSVMDG